MDYYSSGSSRGSRGSYRGSSYRGSSSRGDSRGSRGSRGFSSRGRGTYSSSSTYKTYDSPSPKYSSSYDSSKYLSSSSSYPRSDDYYSRRSESYGTREREHRSDITDLASRKRERSDSYSQGISRRPHEEDAYRSSSRYTISASAPSSAHSYVESRSYDETRTFKKPRTEFKPDYKSDHRVKEPLRTRVVRGRVPFRHPTSRVLRGSSSFRRPRGDSFAARRSTFTRPSATASTSEILAIRRAKLLQKRLKEQSDATAAEAKDKTADKKDEGDAGENSATEVEVKGSGDKEMVTSSGKPFMKLVCPTCGVKCVTFREYALHASQPVHQTAIKVKADELRTTLAAMRIAQRDQQKKIEEDDLTSLTTVTHFCVICKLNYSQEISTHESSDLHKKLKEFLLPKCEVCRIKFQSPLLYERHLCSLSHIKEKALGEEREKKSLPSSGILDRFMVLDSVGSGDEADDKDDEKTAAVTEEKEEADEDLMLGLEYIHEVRGQYCEVCRMFLPLARDYSAILRRHCRTKDHLRCYLHYGNETLLEKMATRNTIKDDKAGNNESKDGDSEEPLDENKLWDGLSEILDEAQPNPKSDDEDDEEGVRFDRFKSKEKNENGEVVPKEEPETQNGDTAGATIQADPAPQAAVA